MNHLFTFESGGELTCEQIHSSFSAYLDGAVSGREMQAIAGHLEACPGCAEEFAGLRAVQQSLASIGPARVPADLGLRLRLAISHEHARLKAPWFEGLASRWENAIRPMVVQISAGLAATGVIVGSLGLLVGMVAAPEPVLANDEPLGATTSPHFLYSAAASGAVLTAEDATVVVEAKVNDRGRVYDYTIVSGPEDPAVRAQVVNQLVLYVFEPASVFGAPVRSQVVLTFAGISVHA